MTFRLTCFSLLVCVFGTVLFANAAQADDYPSHPIRLIVPYAAGGSADATARVIARQIGKTTGHTIVVENRGGSFACCEAQVYDKDGELVASGRGTYAIPQQK